MRRLVPAGRLAFGAWMLVNGANHFVVSLYPQPMGHEPLAIQLMAALAHSRLFDVAMVIQLLTGALILADVFVAVALCIAMPISVCAVYWAVILEHQPLVSVLALAAFALNGLLMLAYIDHYRDVLQRRALTLGDRGERVTTYENVFADPRGRTSRGDFLRALIPLLAAAALYFFLVGGRNGEWVLATLLFPATMLHARRLHDMGHTAWLLLIPTVLNLTAVWLHMYGEYPGIQPTVTLAALVVSGGFVLWGMAGKGQPQANRFDVPAAG